jgi:microcystin-dependent protein
MTDKTPKKKAKNTVELHKPAIMQSDSVSPGQNVPQAKELKVRFKAGSIPLQTDFADLIDLANIGRQAVGGADGQNGPGNGFTLSSSGLLTLKSSEGISVEQNGISIKAGNGITVDSNGVSTKAGNGITVDSNGVSTKAGNGITVDSGGVSTKAGNGITVDSNGVSTKAGNGITVDLNGVSIKAGNGITVDSGGVSIDQKYVLPKGTIVMFHGTDIPNGWALCDGRNNTPNLIERFIRAGTLDNLNKTGGSPEVQTKPAKTNITVGVQGHILSTDEMPAHTHGSSAIIGNSYDVESSRHPGDGGGTFIGMGKEEDLHYSYFTKFPLDNTGGNNAHTHSTNITDNGHYHSLENITPPYYVLAFIMKT